MAVYRIIIMNSPNIAMNVKRQRRITYELVVLEWATLFLLFAIFGIGKRLRGTNVISNFDCSNQSMEITEKPEWVISFGKQIHSCGVFVIQMFIIAEFIMYIILFKEFYEHNKELQNKNSLGISVDKLFKRQKKNVITLSGQCFTFVIEIVITLVAQFAIHLDFSPLNSNLFLSTLLVASYFVASDELKTFYFKE